MIHNHEVPGSIPGPATKRKSLDIRHLRGFHSWVSFLFIKAFAQILHEFTKLCFYEKGHKKELGSGYKTATKLLAGTKILLSFHFLSSLVTFHFNTLRISGLPVTTRRIDSDDQYFVVTVKNKLYADYLNTQLWYLKYQCLVLGIPKSGTWNTNIWYLEYQRLVLNIPKGGIQMGHVGYCFIACYK